MNQNDNMAIAREARALYAHDFHFYRIEPVVVRYIGGFGRIH